MHLSIESGVPERDELLAVEAALRGGERSPGSPRSVADWAKERRSVMCRTATLCVAGLLAIVVVAGSVGRAKAPLAERKHTVSVARTAGAVSLSEDKHAALKSGDTIFLRAHTSKFIEVVDSGLEARSPDPSDAKAFVVEKQQGGGEIQTGDVVYLQAHTGSYVSIDGTSVHADALDKGTKEALVITTKSNGTIHFGDEVYFKAHTGRHIDVDEMVVKAQYSQKAGFQAFIILEKEHLKSCAKSGESCIHSACCEEAGMQCYKKDDWWAQCKETCSAGPDPTDQSSPMPWSCEELGTRTAGNVKECSAQGEGCMHSKCCEDPGLTCFEKNSSWASCKPSCTPGLDMTDSDWMPWSCKALGPQTPSAAPWVQTQCAAPGADCSHSQCCSTPGQQCYLKNQFYGECRDKCTPGEKLAAWDQPWNCSTLGARTPASVDGARGTVKPWVLDRCSNFSESCIDSQCCLGVGQSCFKKNDHWAVCMDSCNSTKGAIEENQTWSCEALSSKSEGLALKGYPSLYCVSVMRVEGYEKGLMQAQMKVNGGIFACDGFDIVADGVLELGTTKDGRTVQTLEIPKITVGVSQDGTAANTKLFMKFWDRIIATHKFNYYDWTAKVDPDAVLLPWRLRQHMLPHVGMNVYVVNCNKFPSSPNFPMMYGALEVFSLHAMQAYAGGSGKCGSDFWPVWQQWGEDYFMTHCMDHLGVGRIGDFGVLGDNMCTGANCGDMWTSTFHPFKSIASWMECWGQANAATV